MPIIKSRVKIFLNEMEYSKEFSHTILHKFNVMKNHKFDYNGEISNSNKDKGEMLNHQKPIIKKDSKEIDSKRKSNNPYEKAPNIVTNVVNKDKEKDKEIDILKRNLMKDIDKKDEKKAIIINPNYAFNIAEKKAIKHSLEIETNSKTPKTEPTHRIPESNRNLDRREKTPTPNFDYLKRKKSANNSDKKSSNHSQVKEDSVSNISERKRSDSRGSQEEPKDKSGLKEFMKKMKDTIKKDPNNDDNVIWLKGMDNYIEPREREKYIHKRNDKLVEKLDRIDKDLININNNLLSNNTPKEIKNSKYKDLKEFLETQKMLVELEKIQNEELEEVPLDNEDEEFNEDILNEFKSLDEDLLAAQERDLEYIENEIIELDLHNNIGIPLRKESETIMSDNVELNYDNFEQHLRQEVENELGKDIYIKVYRILANSLNTEILNFDRNKLDKKIKDEQGFINIDIDIVLSKLPDIYCIILKDRELSSLM
jgi:hypothetical protein